MAISPPDWKTIGKGVPLYLLSGIDRAGFQQSVNTPGSVAYQAVQAFGSLDAYKRAVEKYNTLYAEYQADFLANRVEEAKANPTYKESALDALIERADEAKTNAEVVAAQIEENRQKPIKERENRYNTIRSELENQYNNLVQFDPKLSYQGRSSDLPAIFNQQAAQLADAGVTSVANLKVQNGKLVDSTTGKTVSTSNLGGQVAVDRDTGVQKWGDIFSGVQGGANYGIQSLQDGSVVLFPAWEKTKSPIAQIGLGGLESVITPILTVGGALIGVPGLGAVGGAAAGAAAGNTAGQLLASGEVDWEKVALAAGGAAAGQAAFGGAGAEAPAAAEAGATAATSTAVPGSFQAALPELGVQTAATTAGATAVPGSFAAAAPSLLAPVNALGDTAQGLLNQDLEFVSADAAQLWKQTGDVAAVQQNLIAAGVDPIMAAEASNLAALGGTTQSIAASLGQAFPGETVFTSEGLLSGGSTMDEFARDIGGNITSTSAPALGIQDALRMARTGMQLFGPQQQQLLGMGGYGGGGGQAAGVDSSGLLGLLQGKAGVPGVAPLLTPVSIPAAQAQPLLGLQMPQYQPLLGTTTQSLLG